MSAPSRGTRTQILPRRSSHPPPPSIVGRRKALAVLCGPEIRTALTWQARRNQLPSSTSHSRSPHEDRAGVLHCCIPGALGFRDSPPSHRYPKPVVVVRGNTRSWLDGRALCCPVLPEIGHALWLPPRHLLDVGFGESPMSQCTGQSCGPLMWVRRRHPL